MANNPVEQALEHVHRASRRLQEAQQAMTVSQEQFDTDLAAELAAQTTYIAAVNAYIAAVQTASPNLATEDATVATALAGVTAAETALAAAKP
jgi:hypothetical protein